MRITWNDDSNLPIDGTPLLPERLAGQSADEARRTPIRVGRWTSELGELARVEGICDPERPEIHLEGGLSRLAGLGVGMKFGKICVSDDVGVRLGERISGGEIVVEGSAGDWAGAGMTGGLIRVRGDVGHRAGAALPGSHIGMRNGILWVDGSAGDDLGTGIRSGLIGVKGAVGSACGLGMIAGTILVFGESGPGAGSGMKRGTIGLFGTGPVELLPTFLPGGIGDFPFLAIYFKRLAELGLLAVGRFSETRLTRYNGDLAAGGQGEILVANAGSNA